MRSMPLKANIERYQNPVHNQTKYIFAPSSPRFQHIAAPHPTRRPPSPFRQCYSFNREPGRSNMIPEKQLDSQTPQRSPFLRSHIRRKMGLDLRMTQNSRKSPQKSTLPATEP